MSSPFDFYAKPDDIPQPEISVIISTYNRLRSEGSCQSLLKRALDSIIYQTFTNFELILIDDFSTDDTLSFCKELALKDPRVKFYHFKQNSGFPAKRYNFGMSVSRGKYITFMFDDDELELSALNDLHTAICGKFSSCGLVYGLARLYKGSIRDQYQMLGDEWSWRKIHSHNFISNNSVIVKKKAIDLVGGYDEDTVFVRICDWDLWWRIGRKFKVARIEKIVANVYSELQDSIGTTKILNWEVCKEKQKTNRKLPLQKNMRQDFKSRIHSVWFDFYVRIPERIGMLKTWLKNILPSYCYRTLKSINQLKMKFFKQKSNLGS